MRKIIVFVAALVILSSCKKETSKESSIAALQIEVTGLSDKTALSLSVVNQKKESIMSITEKYGNTTYETSPVSSGDVLNVHWSSNIASDAFKNGEGTLTYKFKGSTIGVSGGNLNYKTGGDITLTIPHN